jgi:non-ribosomal peptide synthetase component F
MSGDVREEKLSFWKRQLEGAPTVLPLPTDHPRREVQTFNGGSLRAELPAGLSQSLKALCRRESVTLYMASFAAFGVLLGRLTGSDDILVGTAVAGRTRPEVEGVIGQFVNLLAMRARLDGDPTFRELLARARETTLRSFAHQEMPFWELVREMDADRDSSRPPLVQVGFAAHHDDNNIIESEDEQPELESRVYTIDTNRAALELLLSVDETPEGFYATVSYNTDLFDEATAQALLSDYRALLEAAVEEPGRRVSELTRVAEERGEELAA